MRLCLFARTELYIESPLLGSKQFQEYKISLFAVPLENSNNGNAGIIPAEDTNTHLPTGRPALK